ncbi:unnamed protein product [Moneuplotes crassus]|uniref:Uncharacterized protein n=1 Tax=Euplotes crassus TaxID=5936 RepID=A0AAD1XF02_EUPCR|nr:unnamed protein product [Moneuplotes crassus]
MKSKNKLLMDRFHTISHRGLCNKQRMKSTFSDNSSNIKLKLTGEALEQTKTPLSPKFLKNTHLSKKLKMLIKNREIRKENYLSNQRFGSPIQTAIPQTSRYQSNYKPRNGYFMENSNETKKESSIMTQVKKERSLENLLFHRSGGTNINYKYVINASYL